MFFRFRLFLAGLILGRHPWCLARAAGAFLVRAMYQLDRKPNTSDGRKFIAQEIKAPSATAGAVYTLKCNSCTNEWEADPDKPARCPLCLSKDFSVEKVTK